MQGSIIANEIDREYRLKKYYENKERNKCKDKSCDKCKAYPVCTEVEENNEEMD